MNERRRRRPDIARSTTTRARSTRRSNASTTRARAVDLAPDRTAIASIVRSIFLSFFRSIVRRRVPIDADDDDARASSRTTTTTRASTAHRASSGTIAFGVASMSHRENALFSVTLTFPQPLDRGRRRCRHTTTDDARGDEWFDDDDGQRCVECESVRHARRQGVGDEDGGA